MKIAPMKILSLETCSVRKPCTVSFIFFTKYKPLNQILTLTYNNMQSISGGKFLSMASHAMRAQRCSRQMIPTALAARQPVACKALRNPQHARSGIHNTPLLSCKSIRSGRTICSASADGGEQPTFEALILEKNNEHKVIVYSKTYCP
jgi:hypothetical protein